MKAWLLLLILMASQFYYYVIRVQPTIIKIYHYNKKGHGVSSTFINDEERYKRCEKVDK